MHAFEVDEISRQISEVKSLTVGVSRGLRDLQRGGKRSRSGSADDEVEPGTMLLRQVVSHIVARARGENPAATADRLYLGAGLGDRMRSKAATSPASTTTPGWAAELVETGNVDSVASLAPTSGYAQIASRAVKVDFGRRATIKVPTRNQGPPILVKFVGEGQPIAVGRAGLSGLSLTACKLAGISFFSEELAQWSTPSIESVVRQALDEDLGLATDSVLFGSAAASAIQPAGIFNGVSPLTPTAGGGQAAAVKDVGALLAAISPAGSPVLIGNQATIARLVTWSPALTVPLITSEAMAANALGAVDASALAIANGATGITTGRDAVVHAEDTTPLPIGSVGSPNTIAAPATSLFQSDLVGVRLVSFVSWGLRAASKAAIVNGVTW